MTGITYATPGRTGVPKSIMARHHRMPLLEADYTYAIGTTAIDRLLANETGKGLAL